MRPLMLATLLALSPAAMACGVCIEDKVAAVYDYQVVTRAIEQGHHVVFFHIEGLSSGDAATRRSLETLAETAAGVDRGSPRVSLQTTSLAVAYDPRRTPLARVQAALEKKFAANKLTLAPLKVIEKPGELKEIAR